MGLNQGSGFQGGNFLNIVNGKIVKRVDQGTKGAVERFSEKAQKTFYELIWDSIDGIITAMEIKDSEFGDQLVLTIVDGPDKFILNIPVESRYFNSFAKTFKNIDYQKPVRLSPYSFKDKADQTKTIQGMNISQEFIDGWQKIEWFYTKEKPNGMPEWHEGMSKTDTKIFFLKLSDFFKKEISQFQIEGRPSITQNSVKNESHDGYNPSNYDPNDDLPF